MAYVSVPRDLTKVKTKVALNLTKRQLIGFSVAGLLSFPVFYFTKNHLPNDIAMLLMILIAAPVLFVTLYEKDGLYFEKYFKYILQKQKKPAIRTFQTKKGSAKRRRKKRQNESQ